MARFTGLIGFSFTLAATHLCFAQSIYGDARDMAMADATVSVPHMPYESSNPAWTRSERSSRASFTVIQAHALQELRYTSATVASVLKNVSVAASIQTFGYEAYRRFTTGLSVSPVLTRKIRIGVRATVQRVSITGYGAKLGQSISVGWIHDLSATTRLGWMWRHVASDQNAVKRQFRQQMSLGTSVRASSASILYGTISLESDALIDVRIAASVRPVSSLVIRFGTGSSPARVSMGLGIDSGVGTVDFGVSIHTVLGPSFAVTVGVR